MYSTTYEARLGRTLDAVAMKPVDKIPVSYSGPAYLGREMGLTVKETTTDFPKATDAVIGFFERHPGIDSIHTPNMSPASQATLWYSPVACPGEELGDNELWQLKEQETITFEDYDAILEEGWGPWSDRVFRERLGDPMVKMLPFIQYAPVCGQRLYEAGIPILNGAVTGSPFENLCGGRTLMNFFMDIVDEPELVKQVLDKAMEHALPAFEAQLAMTKPVGAWVGGWRAAPALLSHDNWMEFVWPYLKKLIMTTIDHGVTPVLHFDSCWESELETLKELPARKCLLMLDSTTDMRKARAVLDDQMCLMGDVPASLLAFGTENEVYEYATKLIDDVGPRTGLILSSGCDVPINARAENVTAMIRAAEEYRV